MSDNATTQTPIQAGVQILVFDPGLYAVTFGAERSLTSDIGFAFPRARLDAPVGGPGVALIAAAGEGGWLSKPGETTMVQVTGARVGVLLTTCHVPGVGVPAQLRVVKVADYAVPAPVPAPEPVVVVEGRTLPGIVHVGGFGDVPVASGGWGGAKPGSGLSVEGFALEAPPGVAPGGLEYQGVLGVDWTTPWVGAGEFCGSRGLSLPLLGLAVRLGGEAARGARVVYRARFADGSEAEGADGAPCAAVSGVPLEALTVAVLPRDGTAEAPPLSAATLAPQPAAPMRAVGAVAPPPPSPGGGGLRARPGSGARPAAKGESAKPVVPPKPKSRTVTPPPARGGKPAAKERTPKTAPRTPPSGRPGGSARGRKR